MADSQKRALAGYRKRMKRQGVVRLEVKVHKRNASLVREVADALSDPEREAETRALLKERFLISKPSGLKALLAAAPLEGVSLTRSRDKGRTVKL